MTVVVWDGENLATDRQATDGSHKWETDKAWYVGRGDSIYIVSGVGLLKNIIELREWFRQGENLDKFPLLGTNNGQLVTQQLLVVSQDTGLFVYEDSPHPGCRGFEPCAFGEGKDSAYGALGMEARSVEAISMAKTYSLHCGKGGAQYILHNSTGR